VLGGLVAEELRASCRTVLVGSRRPDVTRPGHVMLDLERPETVERAVATADLVVTTVADPHLVAHRSVLAHGGTLVDLSAGPVAPGRALAREVAELCGGIGVRGRVVLHAGMAPGVTSLVAAELLAAHPEADEVELVFTLSVNGVGGPASGDFAWRGLTAVPEHRTVDVPLPEPWGPSECLGFAETERGWLGSAADGRAVGVFLAYDDARRQATLLQGNAAGAFRELPRAALRRVRPIGPHGPTHEPVAHWVAVLRGGRRLAVRTVECRGDYLHTARVARVLADAAMPRRPGVYGMDEAFTLRELRPALRAAGIAVVDRSVFGDELASRLAS
jgi:hypothetical protein